MSNERMKATLTGIAVMLAGRLEKLDQDLELTKGDEFRETEIRIAELNYIISNIRRISKGECTTCDGDGYYYEGGLSFAANVDNKRPCPDCNNVD